MTKSSERSISTAPTATQPHLSTALVLACLQRWGGRCRVSSQAQQIVAQEQLQGKSIYSQRRHLLCPLCHHLSVALFLLPPQFPFCPLVTATWRKLKIKPHKQCNRHAIACLFSLKKTMLYFLCSGNYSLMLQLLGFDWMQKFDLNNDSSPCIYYYHMSLIIYLSCRNELNFMASSS